VETEEAFLKELKDFAPDIILADYNLPSFDGITALAIKQKQYPDVPFILVSGSIGEELAIEAVKMGATDYVLKHRLSRLVPSVHRALREAEDRAKRKQAEEELQRSFKKLQSVLEGIKQAIALTVEVRDPYTAGHQRRVANLACAIAQEMGLPDEQIDEIRTAAVLHDIGKVAVPAEILSKPGRISNHEFDIIKSHPQVSYDILKEVEFPWPIARIVLQHHERMDGSGYPSGLSGKDILLGARILAVADVIEAMSSHRPYRPAHGIDKALQEISQNRNILYNGNMVDACLRLFTERGFKFE